MQIVTNPPGQPLELSGCDEAAVCRIAELLALMVQPGDVIGLSGDLGAGKTTFARAFIRAMLDGDDFVEIPSPTFTLVQIYPTPRMDVAHFDLYRLAEPDELLELGLDHALEHGIALIEWPERAGDLLPHARLSLHLADDSQAMADSQNGSLRTIALSGEGAWKQRALRFYALHSVFKASGWDHDGVRTRHFQGDASARRYGRIEGADGASALIMDSPRQPDGPPIKNGLPYSRIAHLAEDVRAFVAVDAVLRRAELRAPEIFATDIDNGLLVLEDLGDCVFKTALERGHSQEALWRAAMDVLLSLRNISVADPLAVGQSARHHLHRYDAQAMMCEVELLPDWYWPAVHGTSISKGQRDEFTKCFEEIIVRLQQVEFGWVLRDFHSPNLIWIDEGVETAKVGLIDFQDAVSGPPAYDLVSLLQDARLDVPHDLEQRLLNDYCTHTAAQEPDFDRDAFIRTYAALGAQRNTKILGIFARLAMRDGKSDYLAHIPRIWAYLQHNLEHPDLADLRAWFDGAFPLSVRGKALDL